MIYVQRERECLVCGLVDSFASLSSPSFQMVALRRGQRMAAAPKGPPHAVAAGNAKHPLRDSTALVKSDSPADTASTVSGGVLLLVGLLVCLGN